MVGRFVKEKGFHEFIEAARMLTRESSEIYFLAVGHQVSSERKHDRFSSGQLDSLSDAIDLEHFIVLTDRDDMPELYACMDAHVLPSYREGFPRALMEGAAMGLPQVATQIRGCRQTVVDGVTGFLVEPGDAASLAERLKILLRDEALRLKMGAAARSLALKEFDQRAVFGRVADCYRTLLHISVEK
jgi:glycosyltransferase involved in cell wall biosynthesis